MWHSAKVTSAPASEPITATEVKAHCSIDSADDDALLEIYIAAARDYVQSYTGSKLIEQTVTVQCDWFDDLAAFPEAPVKSISSISYLDAAGDTQTLATSVYQLRDDGSLEPSIELKYGQAWPATLPFSRITVVAVVGYAALPPAIKAALLLHVADAYAERESKAAVAFGTIDNLLANYRRPL